MESPEQRERGRILRVKRGYNPNSSSMGSIVYEIPVMLLGATVLFGATAGLLAAAFGRGRSEEPEDEAQAAPESTEEPDP